MCLIGLAIDVHPRWPLVIAANRDEYRNRPTAPLSRWITPAGNTVLSGRDLRAGGTWLGVTAAGRVAMLTNVRQGRPEADLRSRGELVLGWLDGQQNAAEFAQMLDADAYAGFNLIVGDAQTQRWHCLSNTGEGGSGQPLSAGIYGLSNASLDTPWRKTVQLKSRLKQALSDCDSLPALQQRLMHALHDDQRAPVEQLPHTGVPPDMEHGLSSAWVDLPQYGYGTRSSLVLVVSRQPNGGTEVTVKETSFDGTGSAAQPPLQFSLSW